MIITIPKQSAVQKGLDRVLTRTRDNLSGVRVIRAFGKEEGEQEAFKNDKVQIIVATSAFGMGVDKSDVGLVIHYDISDSLENYVQEAGRAGRDPRLSAKCYVLYSDKDLDKHFILLNQTKLSISEIQQVWKAVKDLSKQKQRFFCSALELARQAGWDDSVADIETRVRTALSALEQSGYIERGNNVPHVFATGITVKNMEEARNKISQSLLFEKDEVENAVRIIKSLISQKHIAKAQDSEAESRVDYLADILGLTKKEVISSVERMRQEGILADTKDISAYVFDGDTQNKSQKVFDRFANLEQYILQHISDDGVRISYKQLNENAITDGITQTSEKDIRTLLYYLTIKSYIRKSEDPSHNIEMFRHADMEKTMSRFHRRISICRFVLKWVYVYHHERTEEETKNHMIQFSIVQLLNNYNNQESQLFQQQEKATLEDVEEALKKEQNNNARNIEVTDRAVQDKDMIVLDFEGFVDGVAFEGGKGENYPLTIGSKTFIPGFEDQLIGAELNKEVEVKVSFPVDYQAEDLAGKPAVFKCKIHEVKEKQLPELDEDFEERRKVLAEG